MLSTETEHLGHVFAFCFLPCYATAQMKVVFLPVLLSCVELQGIPLQQHNS